MRGNSKFCVLSCFWQEYSWNLSVINLKQKIKVEAFAVFLLLLTNLQKRSYYIIKLHSKQVLHHLLPVMVESLQLEKRQEKKKNKKTGMWLLSLGISSVAGSLKAYFSSCVTTARTVLLGTVLLHVICCGTLFCYF